MLTEMKGIVMDFGPVRAVDHVDFSTYRRAKSWGLLGENRRGKIYPDERAGGHDYRLRKGEILLNGETRAE